METGSPPPRTHQRKTKDTPPKPGHERCQHTWKLMGLGVPPQPTAPWRIYIFRVHCLITQRWMKIRVPFEWYWYGDKSYGDPEVEAGTIADRNPTPPQLDENRIRQLESQVDQIMRGPDTGRGGR